MNQPILRPSDQRFVEVLMNSLPQAVIVQSEQGLDSDRLVDLIISSQPTIRLDVEPLEGKTTVSAEQIREMLGSLRTFADQRRVIVIPQAEQLSEVVQNILLKSLEEPNANTHFLLVTDSIDLLLPTIKSRCQVVTLGRTTTAQDQLMLRNLNLDERTHQQILFLASGRPALIRQLATQPTKLEHYQKIAKDAKKIMSHWGSFESLVVLNDYIKDRQSAKQLIGLMIDMLHFQARSGIVADPELIDRLSDVERSLNQNGNPRVALLSLAV